MIIAASANDSNIRQWLWWALLAGALSFQLANLAFQPLLFDEASSLVTTSGYSGVVSWESGELQPMAELIRTVRRCPSVFGQESSKGLRQIFHEIQRDNHPPLFFIILSGWRLLCGDSLTSLRLLPLLFSILTAYLVFLIGKRLHGVSVGLVCATLYAWTPAVVQQGINLRMYSLALLFYASSLYSIIRLWEFGWERHNPKLQTWQLTLGLSLAGGFLSHYYFLWWAIGLLIALILVKECRARLSALIFPVTIVILTVAPWMAWGFLTQDRILKGQGLFQFITLQEIGMRAYMERIFSHVGALFMARKLFASGNYLPGSEALLIGIGMLLFSSRSRLKPWRNVFIYSIGITLLLEIILDVALGRAMLGWGAGRTNIFVTIPIVVLLVVSFDSMQRIGKYAHVSLCMLLCWQSFITFPPSEFSEENMFAFLERVFKDFQNRTDVVVVGNRGRISLAQALFYAPCDSKGSLRVIDPSAIPNDFTDSLVSFNKILWLQQYGLALPIRAIQSQEWNMEKIQAALSVHGFTLYEEYRNKERWKPTRGVKVFLREESTNKLE